MNDLIKNLFFNMNNLFKALFAEEYTYSGTLHEETGSRLKMPFRILFPAAIVVCLVFLILNIKNNKDKKSKITNSIALVLLIVLMIYIIYASYSESSVAVGFSYNDL